MSEATEPLPTDVAMVKVSVTMLPVAYQALVAAAEREGMSRTDTINRAVQVYETLTALNPGEMLGYDKDTKELVVWR